MTANFVLTFLTLAVLAAGGRSWPPRGLVVAVALVTLVLAYPPFVPLSHFFFELTTPAVVLGTRVVLVALWLLVVAQLVRRVRAGADRNITVLTAVVTATATFWGVVGATVSRFEPGSSTPTAGSSVLWVVQDVTLWSTVVIEVALVVLVTRARRHAVSPST